MKRYVIYIISCCLILISTPVFSQQIVYNANVVETAEHSWSVVQVELKEDCTVVTKIVLPKVSLTWICCDKSQYIEDVETGEKYNIIDSDIGFEVGKYVLYNKPITYREIYPLLPQAVNKINIFSGNEYYVKGLLLDRDNRNIETKANNIINKIRTLNSNSKRLIYKELKSIYATSQSKPTDLEYSYLDSLEDVRKQQNLSQLKLIDIEQKRRSSNLLNIGKEYFRLSRQSSNGFGDAGRYKEDSLLITLALDCYKQAYQNASDINIKVSALNEIGAVLHLELQHNDAFVLFQYALRNKNIDDRTKILSLWGIIRCLYPGETFLSRDIAIKVLPYYQELIYLFAKVYPKDLIGIGHKYAELGYISRTAGDINYVEYCHNAITYQADHKDYHFFTELRNVLIGIEYHKSPSVILGDYYASIGNLSAALGYYNSAYANFDLDQQDFTKITPENIYDYNKEQIGNKVFKQSASYPIHLCKLATIYFSQNNKKYLAYLTEAFYYSVRQLLFHFRNDNLEQRSHHYKMLDYALTAQYNNLDARWVYNAALFIKSLSNEVDSSILRYNISVDGSPNQQYTEYQHRLNTYIASPTSYNRHKLNESEKRLHSLDFSLHGLESLELTYDKIMSAVKGTTNCAIEFVASPKLNDSGSIYCALLITSNTPSPIKVELCNANALNELYSMQGGPYNEKCIHSLYQLIWSKLEPYINEGDNVYFSPDGLLHQINIEVLRDSNGKRANEKWNLHRVSSTRELCMDKPGIKHTAAVLYGGLTYDIAEEDMVAQSRTYRRANSTTAARGFIIDSAARAGWSSLPATMSEVDAIAKMFKSHDIDVNAYTDIMGNEESFKALSGKKTPIIHLATHGFFYKNEEVSKKPFLEQICMESQQYFKSDNSLKRSGLILAGAQKAWAGEAIPDNVEDGILLAEEIAAMDLSGTDLVVLSACETGLGDITSEGVFGLQRAFKKAGVNTLIMSLWQVHDDATSLFMQTFYKHWLDGKSKHEAFTMAQKTMQEHPDYSNPYYWAAFIMLD